MIKSQTINRKWQNSGEKNGQETLTTYY